MTTHFRAALAACSLASLASSARAQTSTPTLPEWRLSAAPVLSIGGEGNPQTEFLHITGAWRLSTGGVAVLDRSTNEFRVFDARGTRTGTFGRKGAGPGEFDSIIWTGHSGDTAFVFDASNNRITTMLLSEAPRLIGTVTMTATGGRARFSVTGRMSDGRWVVTTSFSPSFDGPVGVHRLSMSTGIIPASAAGSVEWIESAQSGAIFVHNPSGDPKQAIVGLTAFSPWFYATGSGSSVWFGESSADSIVRFEPAGIRQRVALPFAPVLLTAAMVKAERVLDSARNADAHFVPDARTRAFDDVKYGAYLPKQVPLFAGMVAATNGGVWVPAYASDHGKPSRYVVIGPRGTNSAWVTAPAGVHVTDAGDDFVVGVHQDADGVESVRVYQLRRG